MKIVKHKFVLYKDDISIFNSLNYSRMSHFISAVIIKNVNDIMLFKHE